MSLKIKLISCIVGFCMIFSLLVVGVFAVKQAQLNVGGSISFTANGVRAKISNVTLDANCVKLGDKLPEGFEINTTKDEAKIKAEAIEKGWGNIQLGFAEGKEVASMMFTVTNLHETEELSVLPYVDRIDGHGVKIDVINESGANVQNGVLGIKNETETFTIQFTATSEVDTTISFGIKVDLAIASSYPVYDPDNPETMIFTKLSDEANCVSVKENPDNAPTGVLDIPGFIRMSNESNKLYRVIEVGKYGFDYKCNITSLIIPTAVKRIQDGAFSAIEPDECFTLTLNHGVESIGLDAFYEADMKGSLILPYSLRTIGANVFGEIYDLEGELNIPEGVESIGDFAFSAASFTKITIPSTVQEITGNPFVDNCDVTSVVSYNSRYVSYDSDIIVDKSTGTLIAGCLNSIIPANKGITTIREGAFQDCGLASIVIPESVTTIEAWAFSSCNALKTVIIDSPTIAKALIQMASCGQLVDITSNTALKTVKVKVQDGITPETVGSYLRTTFPYQREEGGYYIFERNV